MGMSARMRSNEWKQRRPHLSLLWMEEILQVKFKKWLRATTCYRSVSGLLIPLPPFTMSTCNIYSENSPPPPHPVSTLFRGKGDSKWHSFGIDAYYNLSFNLQYKFYPPSKTEHFVLLHASFWRWRREVSTCNFNSSHRVRCCTLYLCTATCFDDEGMRFHVLHVWNCTSKFNSFHRVW